MVNLWETATEDNAWRHQSAIFTPEAYLGVGRPLGRWMMSTDEKIIEATRQRNPEHVLPVKTSVELEEALVKKHPALPGFTFLAKDYNAGIMVLSVPNLTTNDLNLIKQGCKEYKQQFYLSQGHTVKTADLRPKPNGYHHYKIIDEEFILNGNYLTYNPEQAKQISTTIQEYADKVYREGLVERNLLLEFRNYLAKQITNHLTKFSGALLKDARGKFSYTFSKMKEDLWADIEEALRWIEICRVDCQPKTLLPTLLQFEPYLPGLLKHTEENKKAIAKWIEANLKEAKKKDSKKKAKKICPTSPATPVVTSAPNPNPAL